MAIANIYWLPTMVLLVTLIVVTAACFLLFASLRAYRRRRNWIIYAFIAGLLGVTAFEAYDTSIGPAIVTYTIDATEKQFNAATTNQFNIKCTNLGNRQTNFNLIISSTNASLIAPSQQGCSQINSTTIKIPFTLENLRQTETKTVQFTIDRAGASFGFSLSMDYQKDNPIVTGGTVGAQCIFDNATNHYTMSLLQGPVV